MNALTFGIITENYSDEHPGKVRVSLPRMSEEGFKLAWIPVMSPYAGNGYGQYWIPEVGESVVVGFMDNDPHSGFVLGSLWNKQNAAPDSMPAEKNERKAFQTKAGHSISFDDTEDKGTITIKTSGGLMVELTDESRKITVTGKDGKDKLVVDTKGNKVEITADKEIKLKGGDLKLEGKNVTIKGSQIDLKSDGGLKLGGQTLEIKGTSIKLDGTSFEAKGSTVKIESSSMLTLKGSMTKIN